MIRAKRLECGVYDALTVKLPVALFKQLSGCIQNQNKLLTQACFEGKSSNSVHRVEPNSHLGSEKQPLTIFFNGFINRIIILSIKQYYLKLF